MVGIAFAIHPIHTEAVAWISGRSEILFTAAGAAAWWFHLKARQGGLRYAVPAVIGVAASLGFKETAVIWPLIFAVGDALFPPFRIAPLPPDAQAQVAGPRPRRVRLPVLYAVYGLLIVLWLLARHTLIGQVAGTEQNRPYFLNPLAEEAWWPARPFTCLRILALAVDRVAVPFAPCFDYGFNQIPLIRGPLHLDALLAVAGMIVWAAAAGMAWAHGRAGIAARGALLAGAVFLIAWLPVSNLFFPVISMLAERNLYLPSLGWCLALGIAAEAARRKLARHRAWLVAGGVVLAAAMSALTLARNTLFSSEVTLAASTSANCPASARGHFFHGSALAGVGREKEAVDAYRRAVEIAPEYAEARAELAMSLARSGRRAEAAAEALRARASRPRGLEAQIAVAAALAQAGSTAESEEALSEIRVEFPDNFPILSLDAERLEKAGRLDEALIAFRSIQSRYPENPAGRTGEGRILTKQGDAAGARKAFEAALDIDPFDPDSLYLLGLLELRASSGDPGLASEAERHLERFVRIRPLNAMAWMRLAQARERLGKVPEAETAYRRAVQIGSGHEILHRALESFLVRQGRRGEASGQGESPEKSVPEPPPDPAATEGPPPDSR